MPRFRSVTRVRVAVWFVLLLSCGVPEPEDRDVPKLEPRPAETHTEPSEIDPVPDLSDPLHPRVISYRRVFLSEVGEGFFDRFDGAKLGLLEKLNRCDRNHLPRLEIVVLPDVWDRSEIEYSPLPRKDAWAAPHDRALVVDLRQQAFGAYEKGMLIRWGPVNSGRRGRETPVGEFHLNWRSRGRRSTVNPDWYLAWYFNFHNRRGLSFHAYALPGYPASHACLRLLDRDARWLYEWGEEWTLDERGWEILEHGTPLRIRNPYDFKSPPPWTLPDLSPLEVAGQRRGRPAL